MCSSEPAVCIQVVSQSLCQTSGIFTVELHLFEQVKGENNLDNRIVTVIDVQKLKLNILISVSYLTILFWYMFSTISL